MPSPLVNALIAHCDSVFLGPNGDYAAVMEVLAGLPAAQAVWKPVSSQNSIWQIVEHLAGSNEWLIEMLQKGRADPPIWIDPAGDESAWQASLAKLKDSHRRLQQALESLSDRDLLAVPDQEDGHTLLELILSSGPAHAAHHSGQLDYIKGLQAAAK